MPFWIAISCLAGALLLLLALAAIDLKTRLLPDKLVLPFALLGALFHAATDFTYLTPAGMALGGAIGFGALYLLRALANHLYKMDALGLGDVKLMGAAGLWLGPDTISLALMLGALAGLFHGLAVALWQTARSGRRPALGRLQIPAGPGFALGIIASAVWFLRDFLFHFLPGHI